MPGRRSKSGQTRKKHAGGGCLACDFIKKKLIEGTIGSVDLTADREPLPVDTEDKQPGEREESVENENRERAATVNSTGNAKQRGSVVRANGGPSPIHPEVREVPEDLEEALLGNTGRSRQTLGSTKFVPYGSSGDIEMSVLGRDNDPKPLTIRQHAVQTIPGRPIADRRSGVPSQEELNEGIREARELSRQAQKKAGYPSSTDDRDGALIVSAEPSGWRQWKVHQLLTTELMRKKRARKTAAARTRGKNRKRGPARS